MTNERLQAERYALQRLEEKLTAVESDRDRYKDAGEKLCAHVAWVISELPDGAPLKFHSQTALSIALTTFAASERAEEEHDPYKTAMDRLDRAADAASKRAEEQGSTVYPDTDSFLRSLDERAEEAERTEEQ
jgi:hypothetical protein